MRAHPQTHMQPASRPKCIPQLHRTPHHIIQPRRGADGDDAACCRRLCGDPSFTRRQQPATRTRQGPRDATSVSLVLLASRWMAWPFPLVPTSQQCIVPQGSIFPSRGEMVHLGCMAALAVGNFLPGRDFILSNSKSERKSTQDHEAPRADCLKGSGSQSLGQVARG